MFSLISTLGLALLLGLIAFLFIRDRISDAVAPDQDGRGGKSGSPSILIAIKKYYFWLLGIAIFMSLTSWLFFYSYAGYQYFLVYPNGTKSAVTTEGIKFAPFASVQEWNKNIDIKTVAKNPEHATDFNSEEGISELEGIMNPIDLRFIDQVTGTMNVTTRFEIPVDHEQFIKFAVKYRNITNLVHNTLIPTISEQAKNTGFMFSAQDYISGAAQSFKQTFEEQLENGAYVVLKEERRDTIYEEIVQKGPRHIKEIQTSYTVQKVMDPKTHKPEVVPNEISLSGIKVSQVIVDNVIPDPEYQARLKEQKSESAKRQLEQQKIATAKIAQLRVVAEGEQRKAEERVTQEVEQVKTLIPFETEREKEKAKLAAAQIARDRAAIEAQTLLIMQRAQADANKLKVLAGLTPQERAYWKYRSDSVISANLSKIQWPGVYFDGASGGKSTGMIESLIGAEMAKQMLNRSRDNNP